MEGMVKRKFRRYPIMYLMPTTTTLTHLLPGTVLERIPFSILLPTTGAILIRLGIKRILSIWWIRWWIRWIRRRSASRSHGGKGSRVVTTAGWWRQPVGGGNSLVVATARW